MQLPANGVGPPWLQLVLLQGLLVRAVLLHIVKRAHPVVVTDSTAAASGACQRPAQWLAGLADCGCRGASLSWWGAHRLALRDNRRTDPGVLRGCAEGGGVLCV